MPDIGEIKQAKEIEKRGHCSYVWGSCSSCGKEYWKILDTKPSKTGMCSKCWGHKRGSSLRGDNHPSYKGGRFEREGYIIILLQPDDFFYAMAGKDGHVKEHRLVMARSLGRCLQSWEIVHHKGIRYSGVENRSDNSIDNLELTIRGDHIRGHQKGYHDGYQQGFIDGKDKQVKEWKHRIQALELLVEG